MERSGFAGCNDPVCASGNGPCEGHSGMFQPMNGYGVVEPIHEAVALEDHRQMEQERRHASSGEPMIAGLLFLAALVRQIVNDIRTWEPHALANGPIELHAVELFETRYSETPDHIGTVEVSYHADAKYSSIDGHLVMSASQWHALYGVTADGRAVLYAN